MANGSDSNEEQSEKFNGPLLKISKIRLKVSPQKETIKSQLKRSINTRNQDLKPFVSLTKVSRTVPEVTFSLFNSSERQDGPQSNCRNTIYGTTNLNSDAKTPGVDSQPGSVNAKAKAGQAQQHFRIMETILKLKESAQRQRNNIDHSDFLKINQINLHDLNLAVNHQILSTGLPKEFKPFSTFQILQAAEQIDIQSLMMPAMISNNSHYVPSYEVSKANQSSPEKSQDEDQGNQATIRVQNSTKSLKDQQLSKSTTNLQDRSLIVQEVTVSKQKMRATNHQKFQSGSRDVLQSRQGNMTRSTDKPQSSLPDQMYDMRIHSLTQFQTEEKRNGDKDKPQKCNHHHDSMMSAIQLQEMKFKPPIEPQPASKSSQSAG